MFVPYQIVYLPWRQQRLYTELIQRVERQGKGWVRPLSLVELSADGDVVTAYDLRSSSDLIWPLAWFQPALDTEVLPLLSLMDLKDPPEAAVAQVHLHRFMAEVWAAQRPENR